MSENFFSIVMPVYNDEKNVTKAIQSIINQTYENWELIILDDCSKDNSYNIAKKYSSKNKKIRLYKMDKNIGAPACMNLGTAKAKYNWVGIIDSDATAPKNWLKEANKNIYPHLEVFGGRVEYIPLSKNYFNSIFFLFEKKIFSNQDELYNFKNFKEPMIAGTNFFYTKKVFNKIRGFNENMRVGYDRIFLSLAIENGFDVKYDSQLSVFHPLYNYKNLSSFFKRYTYFMKWRNRNNKDSRLMKNTFNKIPLSLAILSGFIILFLLNFGLKVSILIFVFIFSMFLLIYFCTLCLQNKIPLKFIPGYIIINIFKKSMCILIYLFKMEPKSAHWK
jgi:glycosyltransferase involved in cell wall biosynthesis